MHFTLDDDFKRLDWRQPHGQKPDLNEQQAMVVAVASIASALDEIAFQLNQAMGPLQEIADNLQRSEPD